MWNNYRIVGGCWKVDSILKSYVFCKVIPWKTLAPPETSALLSYSVNCNLTFENADLDFAENFCCKGNYYSSGDLRKCYILLFASCVTRFVSLELTAEFNTHFTPRDATFIYNR